MARLPFAIAEQGIAAIMLEKRNQSTPELKTTFPQLSEALGLRYEKIVGAPLLVDTIRPRREIFAAWPRSIQPRSKALHHGGLAGVWRSAGVLFPMTVAPPALAPSLFMRRHALLTAWASPVRRDVCPVIPEQGWCPTIY
ncbi:MAG: hypothetical protein V4472_16770 [Pseudomonadota bacterium]